MKKIFIFIQQHQNNFYIAMYGEDNLKQAVGMFALFDLPIDDKIQAKLGSKKSHDVKTLDYFYIINAVRGQGIGNIMIQEAKKIAKELGADLITFDTLNPLLNRFYEKNGAKVVCDSQYCDISKNNTHPKTFSALIIYDLYHGVGRLFHGV